MMSPFVPHITEELWHLIGYESFILNEPWPEYNLAFTKSDQITLVVQINGKVRARVEVDRDTDKQELESIALSNDRIRQLIEGKTVKKVIVVPNKLVNIVVS